MTPAQTWTTETQQQHQQFSYWREVLCAAFVMLDPVAKAHEPGFIGQVTSRPLGDLAQIRTYSRKQFVNRGDAEIRRNPIEYCFVNFQLEGACVVRQDGRECLVTPGEFSVVDSTRPYYLDFRDDWRVLTFRIPRSQLASRLAAPHKATARKVDTRSGLGLVASNFARTLDQLGPMNPDINSQDQESLAAALNAVVAIALGATTAAQESDRLPARQAFRKAIETYIADHLADPSLSPDTLADKFRVSRRTLYGLFEESRLSVSGIIREQRLERSARDLSSARHGSILDVALRWGFNDASHYSRLFKNHFKVSPREYASNRRAHDMLPPAGSEAKSLE